MDDFRSLIEKLPLLQFLPPDVRNFITDSFVPTSFSFGTPIISEGEETDAFYVLVSGRARVVKLGQNGEEIPLTSLRPGESFGEMGLLDETTSKATVRASTDVEVLRLDKSVFKTLVHRNPEIRTYFELQTKHRTA